VLLTSHKNSTSQKKGAVSVAALARSAQKEPFSFVRITPLLEVAL
jgi:hypothetical protein